MFDVINQTVKAFSQMRLGPWQALGDVLLVGEGNLSFAKSLLKIPTAHITYMIATTFESEKNLPDGAAENAQNLKCCSAKIMHNVDATHLEKYFGSEKFDTIIFQFPNVGSRDSKYGHNPNHVMIRKFLRSAANYLNPSGKVMISAVDSPYYEGVFQFDEAAKFADFETLETYSFDPTMFPGYSHTNTNDDDSVLDDHNRFATWVFRLKK